MQFIKKIVNNLPLGILPNFDSPDMNYTLSPFEAHPKLVKSLSDFLFKNNNSVVVVYLCVENYTKFKGSTYRGSYNEIIRLFNQITESYLVRDSFSLTEIITFHKMSEDDFVIYFALDSSFKHHNDEGDELLQELCFQIKLHIEQNLNNAIKHWFPDSLNITVCYSPISLAENKKDISRQVCSQIVQAIRIMHSSPPTAKSIVYQLHEIIRKQNVSIVYQPIVGLDTGEILGYEALSRGPKNTRFASPAILFPLAEENGVLYSLEKLCREMAIKNAQNFGDKTKLFLNINPQVINDPKFTGGMTKELLKETGLTPQNLVFEITERTSIKDFVSFKNVLQHYRRQGYSVAIDDAGAGYSSLQAIAELKPHYIKLDTSLIRDIDHDPVKEALLETFVLFSKKINAKLIAEGIERREELEKLKKLGVDFGQGFFLAKPEYPVPAVSHESSKIIMSSKPMSMVYSNGSSSSVMEITQNITLIDPETTVEEVYAIFEQNTELEGLPVGSGNLPYGLIMRNKLLHDLSTKHGFALYSKRPIRILMNPDPLIVNQSLSIENVAQLAMDRSPQHLYDCVIVVDNRKLTGIVCVRHLLDFINNKQIELARNANPLTGLPGNIKILEQLISLIDQNKPFSVIYLDLDNFKAYNDKYGFERGDQAILFTSEILVKATDLCSPHRPLIGHIGGDDFIIIIEQVINADCLCQEIIRLFDQGVISLYDQEDQINGGITAKGRTNSKCLFPFMSISCAIVDNLNCRFQNYLQIGEVAAELKKYAKSKPGSVYVRNMRSY